MRTIMRPNVRLPVWVWVALLWGLLLHAVLLYLGLQDQRWMLDDSVQYMTLAQNIWDYGAYSQGYTQPLMPDLQRTPGYPIVLLLLGRNVGLVLLLQHALVGFSAWALYDSLYSLGRRKAGRLAALIYWGMPYPALMASLLLTETAFIAALALAVLLALRFFYYPNWKQGLGSLLALLLASMLKPLALPLLPLWLLLLLWRRPWVVLPACLIVAAVWGPWLVRSHRLSGQWQITDNQDTALLYGQLGGVLALEHGLPLSDDNLFRTADSALAAQVGAVHLRQCRTYQRQECCTARPEARQAARNLLASHRMGSLKLALRACAQMLVGIGLGTARWLSPSDNLNVLLASIQLTLNLLMFMGLGVAFLWLRQWPWLALVLAVLWTWLFFSHATVAWADGRYRLPSDWLLMLWLGRCLWPVRYALPLKRFAKSAQMATYSSAV